MKKALLCGVAALTLASCSPTIETRGNYIDTDRLGTVEAGISTRLDVVNRWGNPTTVAPFNDNRWYYIGEKVELGALSQYDLEQRKIVQVDFDDSGTVADVQTLDENSAQYVEIVDRKTPTAGRELNAIQQMIGNIGKFNANQMQPRD